MKRLLILCLMLVAVLSLYSISIAQNRVVPRPLKAGYGIPAVGAPGYVNVLLRSSNDLNLSSDQVEKLKSIATSFEKEAAKVQADMKVAEIELREILDKKDVSLADVESKINQIESLRSGLRLSMTKAQIEARNLLTDEQLTKVQSLKGAHPFWHGKEGRRKN